MSTRETYFLTKEDILTLQADLIERFGGLPGIKNEGQLEAALAQPNMEAFGFVVHPTLSEQAAAYLFYLTSNHAFHDGNKRIGLHACLVFLSMNGANFLREEERWYKLTLSVADGRAAKECCINFLRRHSC